MVRQRIGNRSAGRVFASLTPNKYDDYSNAIGKRFHRLKLARDFDGRYTFHSIRRTVATMLENENIPENVSAAILGHDIPTMTYGLYSGGAALETKRQAIETLRYPSKPRT